jgi:hypothetical protein
MGGAFATHCQEQPCRRWPRDDLLLSWLGPPCVSTWTIARSPGLRHDCAPAAYFALSRRLLKPGVRFLRQSASRGYAAKGRGNVLMSGGWLLGAEHLAGRVHARWQVPARAQGQRGSVRVRPQFSELQPHATFKHGISTGCIGRGAWPVSVGLVGFWSGLVQCSVGPAGPIAKKSRRTTCDVAGHRTPGRVTRSRRL